jgi:SAM-dependent methyltransferase
MDFDDPAQRAVIFDLHSGLPREGPGDRASLIRALDIVGPLPPAPSILDLACGPGGQTVDLAERIPDAQVTAVDAHEPYLAALRALAKARGVAGRVRTHLGDMASPPCAPASADLIWCEGAAYIIGVEAALRAWKPLLKPAGRLALTEVVWLRPDPPEAAKTFWAAYPAMRDLAGLRAAARAAGYRILGDFILPREAWWTHYYGPMEARLEAIEPRYRDDAVAKAVLADARAEIDLYRRNADSYGYAFLVLEAA